MIAPRTHQLSHGASHATSSHIAGNSSTPASNRALARRAGLATKRPDQWTPQ